jgi:CDP-glucose 4,6-dehydratase
MTVLALTRQILARMGSPLDPDVRGEATHEIAHQCLSAEKARQILGWRPSYGLDVGLGKTIDWYRAFLARSSGG